MLGVVTGIYVMVLSGLQSKVWPSYSYWLLVITSCAASAAAARSGWRRAVGWGWGWGWGWG